MLLFAGGFQDSVGKYNLVFSASGGLAVPLILLTTFWLILKPPCPTIDHELVRGYLAAARAAADEADLKLDRASGYASSVQKICDPGKLGEGTRCAEALNWIPAELNAAKGEVPRIRTALEWIDRLLPKS
jgi:hypothetical protein